MSLKKYIDDTARRQAGKTFRSLGFLNRNTNKTSGFARVKEFKDGNYVVEFSDGTEKIIPPNGVRSVGPGGIIFISDEFQLF